MKKMALKILSIMILLASINVAYAKVKATSPATAQAIKYYKSGNYTQAYLACENIVAKDPSDALAQYYLAMSYVKLGRKSDAIAAYDRVISLSPNGIVGNYAQKGKQCIETPSLCHEPIPVPGAENDTPEDKFIKGKFGSGFSHKARGVHEKEKIENIRRDMNRYDELEPERFKEFKDFSTQAPSNDEIVAAIRTLQKAGLSDTINFSNHNSFNKDYDMLNMIFSNNGGTTNLSPQVIQSMLSAQMSAGF